MKKIVILTVVLAVAIAKDHVDDFAEIVCDENRNYENSTQEACKECLLDFLKPLFRTEPSKEQVMRTFANTMYNCSTHFNEEEGFLKCVENTDLEAEADCVLIQVMRLKGGDFFYPQVLHGYCTEYKGVVEIEECKTCGINALRDAEGDDWIGNAKSYSEWLLEKSKVFFDSCIKFFPSEESVKECYEDENPVRCWHLMYVHKNEGTTD